MNEGDADHAVTVRIALDHRTFEQIQVHYETLDGSATAPTDYASRSGTLTIPPNTLGATIDVPIRGDGRNETTETFKIALTDPSNAMLGDSRGIVTIVDED